MLTLNEIKTILRALRNAERAAKDEGYTLKFRNEGPHVEAERILKRERAALQKT